MPLPLTNPVPPYTTPLTGAGVYTSPWFDNVILGATSVTVTSYADVASALLGVIIQQTDDTSNVNVLATIQQGTALPGTLLVIASNLTKRYWRFQYTNGTNAQSVFEISATSYSGPTISTLGTISTPVAQTDPVTGLQANIVRTQRPGCASAQLVVEATDQFGVNDPAQIRKLLEAILLELQALNFNMASLVSSPVLSSELGSSSMAI